MEKITTIEAKNGMYRWDDKTLKLFFKKDKDDEEKQIICDKCEKEEFVVEGDEFEAYTNKWLDRVESYYKSN